MKALLVLALTLSACAETTTKLVKQHGLPIQAAGDYEGSPVTFNGTPIYFQFKREESLVNIFQISSGAKLNCFTWNNEFGVAVMKDSEVYIFGVDKVGSVMVSRHSSNLIDWSDDEVVMTALPNQRLYNMSVTADPKGFTMAYEVREPGVSDSFRFSRSTDLQNWNKVGYLFATEYAACPVIRFVDGIYYVIYLSNEDNKFISRIAKSPDLIHWTRSHTPVLTPGEGESINTSDVDLIEINGVTTVFYLYGDQSTWGGMGVATFNGSLNEFFRSYFN